MPRRQRTKKPVVVEVDSELAIPPPPATTTPTGWGDLPNEVLIKIFNELKIDVDENGKPKLEEEKQALLNCRLMNRRWRDVTDDVLEKQCIDFWKVGRPHLAQQETTGSPHCFAVLHFKSTSVGGQIYCPPFLKTKMKMLEKSPSPTNSVCVTQKPSGRVAQQSHKNWTMTGEGVDVFAKFGQHLTAITFFNIDRIGIPKISRILSHTPNLQALTLQRIKVLWPAKWNFNLPSLPNLAHLKLLEIDWMGECHSRANWFNADLSLRILEEYKQRLETFETDVWPMPMHYDKFHFGVDAASFPMLTQLKQLKMYTAGFYCKTLQLPIVGILSLIDLPVYHLMDFIQNPHLLDKSTTTLVQLHIQFVIRGNPDRHPNPHIESYDDVTLPNVKSFTVTFPKCPRGLAAVTGFLKLLPNLDELKFIQLDEAGEGRESTEDNKETVKNHLLEMQYWKVCKKLKAISASTGADDSKPFYTRRSPFPE